MNCQKEDCDGTLNMAYLTEQNSNTINQSFLYVCDKGPHVYLLVPKLIDPELIADGRDQVLLYLLKKLTETEAVLVKTPMHDKSGFMGTRGNNQAYIDLEKQRKFLTGLIRERRALAHG